MRHRLASLAIATIVAVITWGGTEAVAISTPLNANPAAFAKSGDHDPATCGVTSKSFTLVKARACWPSAQESNGSYSAPGRYIVHHKDGHISLMSVSMLATDNTGKVIASSNRDAYAYYNQYYRWSGSVSSWDLSLHFGVDVQGHGYWGNWVSTDYVTPWCAGFGGGCTFTWRGVLYNGGSTQAGANYEINDWFGLVFEYCRTNDTRWNQFSGYCAA